MGLVRLAAKCALFKDDGTLIDYVAFGHDIKRPNIPQRPKDVGVAHATN